MKFYVWIQHFWLQISWVFGEKTMGWFSCHVSNLTKALVVLKNQMKDRTKQNLYFGLFVVVFISIFRSNSFSFAAENASIDEQTIKGTHGFLGTSYLVCSNYSGTGQAEWSLMAREGIFISSSVDIQFFPGALRADGGINFSGPLAYGFVLNDYEVQAYYATLIGAAKGVVTRNNARGKKTIYFIDYDVKEHRAECLLPRDPISELPDPFLSSSNPQPPSQPERFCPPDMPPSSCEAFGYYARATPVAESILSFDEATQIAFNNQSQEAIEESVNVFSENSSKLNAAYTLAALTENVEQKDSKVTTSDLGSVREALSIASFSTELPTNIGQSNNTAGVPEPSTIAGTVLTIGLWGGISWRRKSKMNK